MIDAAVIQLRGMFTTSEDMPANVKEKGNAFLAALDEWSEDMKKADPAV